MIPNNVALSHFAFAALLSLVGRPEYRGVVPYPRQDKPSYRTPPLFSQTTQL